MRNMRLMIGLVLLLSMVLTSSVKAQVTTIDIDPDWERTSVRVAPAWFQTAIDGNPDVIYYGDDPEPWAWNIPTVNTWNAETSGIHWFYTPYYGSGTQYWFRATLPAQEGMGLRDFTLTSTNNPGQGIGINDGIYIFLDGEFTGVFGSVSAYISAGCYPNVCTLGLTPHLDWIFPTGWRIDDATVHVGDNTPAGHEIAIAFEEISGWGGLTKLRIVAEYEDLDVDDDGVYNADDLCPGTLIPESVPTVRLGTNRFALTDDDTVFDTTKPKGKGPNKSFTVTDTGGCSCEQIIAEQGLGKGHTKFGCSISAMEDWVAGAGKTGMISETIEKPDEFVLESNYPNPFNPRTTIRFGVPEASQIHLAVFDVMGRQVATLAEGMTSAGMHEVTFDAQDMPSGMYLCRLDTPQGSLIQTMILMK